MKFCFAFKLMLEFHMFTVRDPLIITKQTAFIKVTLLTATIVQYYRVVIFFGKSVTDVLATLW